MTEKKSFIERLTVLGDKVSSNLYLQAVSQGVMAMEQILAETLKKLKRPHNDRHL